MFGSILNRMIFGELVRVFLLALLALTGMFLLAGLVAEATQRGLAPSQILSVIPLLVPSTLPFTIPATTLFATCVVYGRMAADNEVTAIRSAGGHLGRIIAPSVILGALSAAGTASLYWDFIPHTHLLLRTQVLGDAEDIIYSVLKRQGSLRLPQQKCSMWVREVQGRRLVDVVYKRHDDNGGYSVVARAREAHIRFDGERNLLLVEMPYCILYSETQTGTWRDQTFPIDMPKNVFGFEYKPRPSDLTWQELQERRAALPDEIREAEERAVKHDEPPATYTPTQKKDWDEFFKFEAKTKAREAHAINVELQQRPALAVGCICFVLLGGPVGIWFSKSDYLSAFVSCFLPTVFIYYPLLLCGTNLAKEGRVPAVVGLWAANVAAGIAALIMYSRLFRR